MTFSPRLFERLCSLSILAVVGACGGGGDSSGPEPSVATSITANSSTTITGVAGAAVTELPSVLVRDQRGAPMPGVPVGFTVMAGSGTVTQPSATTNATGIATVGSWTLGTTAGANVLVASSGSLTPVTFTAGGTAGAPAAVSKTAGDAQTATAGSAVAIAPSVTVRDANGNLVSGASVLFTVASGGGSLTGGTQVTNAAGTATVGGWTLGTSTGSNTLSVSAGSATPVTFSATGVAGPAASITKAAGDNQSADAGTPVPVAPSVTVRDANGNPVAGVTVIFAVGSGGGTVTGGTQATNAAGSATVGGWTLGPAAGANTLTATAGSLPPVTFTATAVASTACSTAAPYTIGTTVNAALSTTDCRTPDGAYVDFYTTTTSAAAAYLFTQTAGFDTFLVLFSAAGDPIGVNDDFGALTTSTIKSLMPSGNYVLGASSFDPGTTGSYTLSSSTTSASVNDCEDVFVVRGISTAQTLQTTDCFNSPYYSDDVWIYLLQGQSVNVSMNSTAFDAYLEIYSGATQVAVNNDRAAGTTDAQVIYTATADGFYLIVASTLVGNQTGAYTLIIQ